MSEVAALILRFDALHLAVKLFSAGAVDAEDAVAAEVPGIEIQAGNSRRNLIGYGETADDAIHALWREVLDIDTGREWLRVQAEGQPPRLVQWNGQAWKEREPALQAVR